MPVEKKVVARFGSGDKRLVIEDPETLKVLYDPVRFKVVGLLRDGRTAKELAEELGRPLTSLYYHLNLLVEHGLAEVQEERISGRTVERVFRRAANEFVAHGEVGKVVDGLVDPDARLASMVGHLRHVHQGPGSPGTLNMIQDVTFNATEDVVRRLSEALHDAVRTNVPTPESRQAKSGTRRIRLVIALGGAEDKPGDESRPPRSEKRGN